MRWSFQTTHHDIWDYDVPSQPVLVDVPADDGSVTPALVAPTKRGELFLLDRRDGKPLAAVEEKPVPQTDLPDEQTSKTQPFSVGMPSFGNELVTESKMWGITPLDQMCAASSSASSATKGRSRRPRCAAACSIPASRAV